MKIELLYFDGCPNHDQLLPHLRRLLAEAGTSTELELRKVDDDQQAQRERFLGSPSVRIDGHDIEPGAEERTDFGLKCRLYRGEGGLSGLPRDEWIREALRGASAPARSSPAADSNR